MVNAAEINKSIKKVNFRLRNYEKKDMIVLLYCRKFRGSVFVRRNDLDRNHDK